MPQLAPQPAMLVLMVVASTRPVLRAAGETIRFLSRGRDRAFVFTALVVGPLLGSLITEPAAMIVTALLLRGDCAAEANRPGLPGATAAAGRQPKVSESS